MNLDQFNELAKSAERMAPDQRKTYLQGLADGLSGSLIFMDAFTTMINKTATNTRELVDAINALAESK